jgi:hypothetical protein
MARTFTATTTYIDIGSISSPSTALTLSAWMYPTEAISINFTESGLICKEFGGSEPFASYNLTPSTSTTQWNPAFKVGITTLGPGTAQKTNHTISTNTWYHMAGTWVSGDNVRLYINGVQEGISAGTLSGTISYGAFNTFIGRNQLDVRVFRGRIAEAAIWNTQLSANEVLALALGLKANKIQFPNLVAYYPVWGLHSPEIDLSANSATGTITGTLNQSNHAPVDLFSNTNVAGMIDYTEPILVPSDYTLIVNRPAMAWRS